jgi:hypothetical protein
MHSAFDVLSFQDYFAASSLFETWADSRHRGFRRTKDEAVVAPTQY